MFTVEEQQIFGSFSCRHGVNRSVNSARARVHSPFSKRLPPSWIPAVSYSSDKELSPTDLNLDLNEHLEYLFHPFIFSSFGIPHIQYFINVINK